MIDLALYRDGPMHSAYTELTQVRPEILVPKPVQPTSVFMGEDYPRVAVTHQLGLYVRMSDLITLPSVRIHTYQWKGWQ